MITLVHPTPILVAEDDPNDRFLMQRGFRRLAHPHSLHLVEDGVELLAYLRHQEPYGDDRAHPRPGLILLDLNMPRCDGFAVLEVLAADTDLGAIPVLVVTTSDRPSDRERCLELGARAFFTKPASREGMDVLIDAVADIIAAVGSESPPDDPSTSADGSGSSE